jgi:DNA replication protein DnaC
MTDPLQRLRALGVRLSHESLAVLVAEADRSRLSPLELLTRLADEEAKERAARNLARRTKLATLGSFTTLDRFDFSHPRSFDRSTYDLLLSLDFVRRGENVLLRGPSGVGKTTLAQNLALRALQAGFSVRFSTLAACLADLLRQESLPALERRLKRYTQPHLLVLDELGYLPADSRSADLLYNLVSRRHEQRSIVVTTNLSFKQWPTVFPGAACVVALVDRFAQHCHVLDIDADSWRQKTALRRTAPTSAAASPRS